MGNEGIITLLRSAHEPHPDALSVGSAPRFSWMPGQGAPQKRGPSEADVRVSES